MIKITNQDLLTLLAKAANYIFDDKLYNHLIECFHNLHENKDWNYTTVSAIFIGFDLIIDRSLNVKPIFVK